MLKFNIKLFLFIPPKLTMAHLSPSVDRDRRPWMLQMLQSFRDPLSVQHTVVDEERRLVNDKEVSRPVIV